jgi:hypothetical protein
MSFERYILSNLTFQDYIAVCQCARTLADGYDRKVSNFTTTLAIGMHDMDRSLTECNKTSEHAGI